MAINYNKLISDAEECVKESKDSCYLAILLNRLDRVIHVLEQGAPSVPWTTIEEFRKFADVDHNAVTNFMPGETHQSALLKAQNARADVQKRAAFVASCKQQPFSSDLPGCSFDGGLAVLMHTEKQLRAGNAQLEQEKNHLQQLSHELRVDNAVLIERCTQLENNVTRYEKMLEKLDQENRSLKGELSDIRLWLKPEESPAPLHAGLCYGTSLLYLSNENSDAHEIHGSQSDALSIATSWTWISADVGEQCFLIDALFQAAATGHGFYVRAGDLLKGSQVKAFDDETVLEVACHPELHEVNEVIEICAGSATLPVTPDHRVPVIREGRQCTLQAQDLNLEDSVLVNGAYTSLTRVTRHQTTERVLVVKMTFKPDMPVPVFMPPPAICTKGHYKKPLRRSGMNKRGHPPQEHLSIPDTAERWP